MPANQLPHLINVKCEFSAVVSPILLHLQKSRESLIVVMLELSRWRGFSIVVIPVYRYLWVPTVRLVVFVCVHSFQYRAVFVDPVDLVK